MCAVSPKSVAALSICVEAGRPFNTHIPLHTAVTLYTPHLNMTQVPSPLPRTGKACLAYLGLDRFLYVRTNVIASVYRCEVSGSDRYRYFYHFFPHSAVDVADMNGQRVSRQNFLRVANSEIPQTTN